MVLLLVKEFAQYSREQVGVRRGEERGWWTEEQKVLRPVRERGGPSEGSSGEVRTIPGGTEGGPD